MQFYGEVIVATDIDEGTAGDQAPVIDWGSVDVGMTYSDVSSVEQAVGLTYISNAGYDFDLPKGPGKMQYAMVGINVSIPLWAGGEKKATIRKNLLGDSQ